MYVGIGSNRGDSWRLVQAAVEAIRAEPGISVVATSRLYRTRPVGVADQPAFLNAAVSLRVRSRLSAVEAALDLLDRLKAIERALGRGPGPRWGPRELDLDLLVFGRQRLVVGDSDGGRPRLVVPHPEARWRLFVLAPLADVAAGLAPPGWGERVETARRRQLELEGPEAAVPVGSWRGRHWEPLNQTSPLRLPP